MGSKLIFDRKTYYKELKRQKRKLFLILLVRKISAGNAHSLGPATKNTLCNPTRPTVRFWIYFKIMPK